MTDKLPVHERFATYTIILGILISLVLLHFKGEEGLPRIAENQQYIVNDEIEVTIEGAVEFPRTYLVRKGTRLRDVLNQAKPLAEANLKKQKLAMKLHDGEQVMIPYKEFITVYLEGAVEVEGPLKVEKGLPIQDLIKLIKFKEGADTLKL